MPASRPICCAWDSVTKTGSFRWHPVDTEWRERQRARVAFLAALEDGAGRPVAGAGAIDPGVRQQVEKRLEYWRSPRTGARRAGCASAGCLLLVRLGGVGFLAMGYAYIIDRPLLVGVVLAAFLAVAVPIELSNRRRRRVFASLFEEVCPNCAHDLTGTGVGGEVRLGPVACPECGAPWPLVPPPVPA